VKKWFPLILTVVMAAWFASTLRKPKEKGFHYTEFGRLPLLFNGRMQPMDSLARNSLLQIREKQRANLEPWKSWYEKPKLIPAIEWLTTVMMNPEVADKWPVFRVDNPELITLLKLPEKDLKQQQDGKHFSWAQIQPSLGVMQEQVGRITDREERKESVASHRTVFEKAVMKLHARLVLYMRLKNTVQPQDARDWPAELKEYEALIPPGVEALRAQQAGREHDEAVLEKLLQQLQKLDVMLRFEPPLLIPPPAHEGHAHTEWMRVGDVLLQAARGEAIPDSVRHYAQMTGAFRSGDAPEFNKQIVAYRASLSPQFDRAVLKAGRENFFNRMEPFYKAMVVYVLAGLLACISWFNLSGTLRRSAVWLIALGLIIHTTGLIFRMWLEGRPPVTNLYSSAIFIGWGAVVLGLVLERFYRDGIGVVVASVIAFLTLIIAHHLAIGADTMEMMRAVLDTNFWLATHVVIITLGYASTFVAGFLALIYILRGFFTSTLTEVTGKSLARMAYGIICFATLFSFVGTVLGGIWADQSWGRFWGWDPKENGALIIVLWNALVLHLRWGGIIRERGVMTCAIVGNIVTSWSWFGVNMLGIGLHSYGFMDAAFKWLMAFVVSQLGLVALGMMPLRFWKSFQGRVPVPATPVKPAGGKKTSPATAGA
jgi:ABC-type transport system involved in cytochrome c biogenesis permease subunit